MKRTFKGSLILFGVMCFLFSAMIGIIGTTDEGTLINNIALGTGVTLLFSSFPVMLTIIVSGIGTLISRGQGDEKRKREFTDFGFDDDSRLEEIMQRLSPEQQVYLENRLRNSRLGVNSDDGELMSLNDLLDDFDSKENRM